MKPLWPFFAYYGGKWRAARRYPAPVFDRIVEPFAGAAGYATRYPETDVVLIEKDAEIAALWRFLIAATPDSIRALPLIEMSACVDDLAVSSEARTLIGFWLNKGAARPCRTPSQWMRSGIRPNSFWSEAIRERIASQVDRIKHWTIIEGDFTCADDRVATWFVDPPYQVRGNHYRCSAEDIDFTALGEWCRSRRGQVLVCENDGATWLPFEPYLTIKANEGGRGKSRSAESLWTNDAWLF